MMYTLHHDAEIRAIDSIEDLSSVPSRVKPGEMKLAKQVIATFDADLDLKTYKDEYTQGLRQIIDAKIAGEEFVAPDVQEPARVVDLMEALRRSLDSVSVEKKKPAKAALKKSAKSKAAANAAKKRASRSAGRYGTRRASRRRSARMRLYSAPRFHTRLAISVSCTAFSP